MCSTAVKNALFRSFCTPLYTCQLWSNYSNESIRKLHVAYNNAYMMLYKLPTYCSASLMFAVNNLLSCQAVIRNLTFRFMCRLSASTNDLVSTLLASEVIWRSRIWRFWYGMLILSMDDSAEYVPCSDHYCVCVYHLFVHNWSVDWSVVVSRCSVAVRI